MNPFFILEKKANFIQFEIWLSTQCDVRLEAGFLYSQPIPLTPGTENILWNNIALNFWIFLQFSEGGSTHKAFIFFGKNFRW